MYVCKATIQVYEKIYFLNHELFLIFKNFDSGKWQDFLSKSSGFVVLPKFDQNDIFQKFKKNLI
jgi:hypothetical protein